jgi:hypothetical protein
VPFAVIVALTLVLGALAFALDGGNEAPATAALRPDPLARIVERVERERGLRFRELPDPLQVTPAQAQREGLASLDEDYPPARRRADAEMLALLGLLPAGTDLGETAATTYGEAVAGYYDPRSGRLRIVKGAQTANRVLYEMTVAHELTHALEDQRFDFDLKRMAEGDDAGLAYTAMVEGSATALMYRYAEARFKPQELLGGVMASAFQSTGNLPPFLTAMMVFPYTAGQAFIERLLEVGGGRWTVVDAAVRFRPPASSEQVMHPDAYLKVDEPRRVKLPRVAAALGSGWSELRAGTMGEWLTGQLLARAGGTAGVAAAAGWGGDRYALLGRRTARAFVARWSWDTARDETEFVDALRAWGEDGLPDSSPAGRDTWRSPAGAAVIARRGGSVTLAIAPDVALARRAARSD